MAKASRSTLDDKSGSRIDAIYQAVCKRAVADWAECIDEAVSGPVGEGWNYVDQVLTAAVRWFAQNPEFVRLVRHESLAAGDHLDHCFRRRRAQLARRVDRQHGALVQERDARAGGRTCPVDDQCDLR